MNIGRKIANSQIIGKANSKTKKSLYIQVALADYFHSQRGDIPKTENGKIVAQGEHAINELNKVLILLKNPINIVQPNWGDISPQSAEKIRKLLKIESKLHATWKDIELNASEKIKECIKEIEENIN